MQNLRILYVNVIDSSNIEVTFTENLTPNLLTSNVTIISDASNVPNSEVLGISINGAILHINCAPLSSYSVYYLNFVSLPDSQFTSINGDAIILEDGVSNKYLIIGPLEPDNTFKRYLNQFLTDNIYNIYDDTTLVSRYLQSLAVNLDRALHDIGLVKNENYLSKTIQDERKIRGQGPFDRLDEEGAYHLLRVARTPSDTKVTKTFIYDSFPNYPITLQKESAQESLYASSLDEPGKFNVNTLILNLNNHNVTKIISVVFTLSNATPIYTYNIENLGYQIKDSRYDQDYGSTYLQLLDNQAKLNNLMLEDSGYSPDDIIRVDVEYEYKYLGRVINSDTLSVYTAQDATRETIPSIINVFNLKHAPIVNSSNEIPTLGGIIFTDPNNNLLNTPHSAFVNEIPFRLNSLPILPGQYSIDYENGIVYVFGADESNDGTGPYPPLATYKYRFTYESDIDYVYDVDLLDFVSLPNGSLVNFPGSLTFEYEDVLVPGVDYASALHKEELVERADNRLIAMNAVKTLNSPITNVFRIYNETSGEIYPVSRWSDNKIYFRYQTPPRINQLTNERVTFNIVPNEMLFVNETLTNASTLRIFKIFLNNNTIIAASEDGIASSINTSLYFTSTSIFEKEKWFNRSASALTNVDNLTAIGEYTVDYDNGVIYCAVSASQNYSIGFATYKNNIIVPTLPHLISVDDLYYQIDVLGNKNKNFSYILFDDGKIIPDNLDNSDEYLLNETTESPYLVNNSYVGSFISGDFISGVTNQIKYLRGVYEYTDLINSTHPLNFSTACTSSGFNITTGSINNQTFDSVNYDVDGYYVLINENIPYVSSNITYTFSVIRTSDSQQLWDGSGIVTPGNPVKLILSGINSPNIGDVVNITYTFTINDLSRIVIDYNKGDFYSDYTYLADELILSYEYGDNVLDFRSSTSISSDTEYYVSYKAGALRDALYRNFGNLINIPELTNFDIDFDRERYRDALMAALSSFIQGPTVSAIKNIGKIISHIEPEIIESIFQGWSLGNSLLNPQGILTTGEFELLPGKFNNGVLINSSGQSIKFPINSNIKLEEGSFETWINPQWNGLDNDAELTFTILKDGYAIDGYNIFVGSSEYHPIISDSGIFTLTKINDVIGTPNKNKDGVFIYYDKDISGDFDRWYIEVVDGYVNPVSSNYRITISSNGTFYDSKSLVIPKPSSLSIVTRTNNLTLNITGGSPLDIGMTFISDIPHYIFDFGESAIKNRVSLYKDASGYINFRVVDNDKLVYVVSSDISSWISNELHHVAISWKLNTINSRDEMHLFVDGLEVPNIIRYGQKLQPYLHEKFRTVNPEEILGLSNRDIISSTDLVTISGSATVSSSINFSSYNIFIGDTIFIDEIGFSESGYTILGISGQDLLLDQLMPATLSNGNFSVNRTEYIVTSDIDVAPNTQISTIHVMVSGNDLIGNIGTSTVTSASVNFETENVLPGYSIRIDNPSLPVTYIITSVSGNSLTINDDLPISLTSTSFYVYSNTENEIPGVRATRPSYSISKDGYYNNILTISNSVFSNDLILIRTLGLNHRRIRKEYYVWSDNVENILMTRLPPPISLDEVNITKVITPAVIIGPANSTTIGGVFYSNNLSTAHPSNSQVGRTISITLSGNNVDFSTPVQVTINGVVGYVTISETLTFTDYGTKDTTNRYISLNYINAVVKPTNVTRSAMVLEAKEKYPITQAESSELVPVIKYSYHIGSGYNLEYNGPDSVRDNNAMFSEFDVNNYLIIHQPIVAAGFYRITGVSLDKKVLYIQPTNAAPLPPLPVFSGGIYKILNVNDYRSGLQNGFFTFEVSKLPSIAYLLSSGYYELDYSTYTRMKLNMPRGYAYLGSDFDGNFHINAILDQVKIYSSTLTDTRVGEQTTTNQRSITKDFNSLRPLEKDSDTLMLINFDEFPFINSADFYINSYADKQSYHSSSKVNSNFSDSLVILKDPLVLSNDGILNSKKDGTIEFWTSPLYDTANDPNVRFYFDASSAMIEEAISTDNVSVKISAPAGAILSVTLKSGDPDIDYFAGGKLEIDTQKAKMETGVSISNNSVIVTNTILQVISVKIVGDLTETDYFYNGSIGSDGKTIYLGKLLPSSGMNVVTTYQSLDNNNSTLNTQVIRLNRKLPAQKSKVIIKYLPKGVQGDRISIYKDEFGYINFGISASGTDYLVRCPTRWIRNTWHKVKATYKMNGGFGADEMTLFIDGYRYSYDTSVLFGSGIIYGSYPIVMGAIRVGDGYHTLGNITFKDPINTIYIGSQYTKSEPLFGLINNLRISNISRPPYSPYNEPLDISYNSNLNVVYPLTTDLYTTYLLDSEASRLINEDFTTIVNKQTGSFNFSVNIFDTFGIVDSSIKVKEALEKLIKVLKPANSKVLIRYIK